MIFRENLGIFAKPKLFELMHLKIGAAESLPRSGKSHKVRLIEPLYNSQNLSNYANSFKCLDKIRYGN